MWPVTWSRFAHLWKLVITGASSPISSLINHTMKGAFCLSLATAFHISPSPYKNTSAATHQYQKCLPSLVPPLLSTRGWPNHSPLSPEIGNLSSMLLERDRRSVLSKWADYWDKILALLGTIHYLSPKGDQQIFRGFEGGSPVSYWTNSIRTNVTSLPQGWVLFQSEVSGTLKANIGFKADGGVTSWN